MVRIVGTDISGEKRIKYGLTSIKGIGIRMANAISVITNLDPNEKIGNLSDEDMEKLEGIIKDIDVELIPNWMMNRQKDIKTGENNHLTGPDLTMALREDLNRLKKIKSYRGLRRELGLKVRGQRTRSTGRKGISVGVRRRKGPQIRKKGV